MIQEIIKEFDKKYLEKYPDQKFNDYQYWHIRKIVEECFHEGLVKNASIQTPEGLHPGNNPLMSLMHDMNHDLSDLRQHTEKLSNWLKEEKPKSSHPWVHIEYLKSRYKSIRDQLDAFYVRFKEQQKSKP